MGLLLIATGVVAHEFWLEPTRFRYKSGETMTVDFRVGENFEGEYWDLTKHRAVSVLMHWGNTVKDLTAKVQPSKGKNLSYTFDREGTHLLVMQSDDAYIELEAQKFNAYLEEDGLTNVAVERKRTGRESEAGREYFTRYAKLLVQSGNRTDNTFRKEVGLPMEILIDQNPYTTKPGDYLTAQIMFEHKPLAGALVKVWGRYKHTTFLQNIYTEEDGTVRFPVGAPGVWMISAVHMVASEREGADWHSHWASMVFAIDSPTASDK